MKKRQVEKPFQLRDDSGHLGVEVPERARERGPGIGARSHVHSLPGGGITSSSSGDPHTHGIPGGGQTGSANASDTHTHTVPDGGRTGPPRAP